VWTFAWESLLSRSVAAFSSLAALGLVAAPTDISETSDLTDEDGNPKHVYHFTNDTGKRGISATGTLLPGASGRVYFSAIPYGTAAQAQSALALPRTPSGYFAVPRGNINGPLTWAAVGPNFGQPGGGMEASFPGAVSLEGADWFPLRQ
jgi:hypothetical protein